LDIAGGTAPFRVNGVEIQGTTYTANNLLAGDYELVITDFNNETSTAYITLVQPAQLEVHALLDHVSTFGAADGSINLTVNAECTYFWQTEDGSHVDPYQEDQSHLTAGVYSVIITNVATGCNTYKRYEITQPHAPSFNTGYTPITTTSTNGSAEVRSVAVYPNPSVGSINIKSNRDAVEAYVINDFGAIVHVCDLSEEGKVESLDLKPGVYTLIFTEEDGTRNTERIMIR